MVVFSNKKIENQSEDCDPCSEDLAALHSCIQPPAITTHLKRKNVSVPKESSFQFFDILQENEC